jgi:branched-chain amino acid transport system permease protein
LRQKYCRAKIASKAGDIESGEYACAQAKTGNGLGGGHCSARAVVTGFESAPLLALQAIMSGLLVGGVYGILAVGLSLAFGVMRIINFAHGELVMYGMFAGVVASRMLGIEPLLILPISFLIGALIGVAQYQIVFRHFVGQATLQQLLAAIGCALVLQMIAQLIFGADARTATSIFSGQYIVFGPFFLSKAQIVAFVIAASTTLAVSLLLNETAWGKAVRAVADDVEAAEIVGINSSTVNIGAFALSAGLAGLAGTVLVTYFPVTPVIGFSLMPMIIIACTIGGLGSLGGTFIGGIFCGVVQQITAMMWNSALQDVPLYILLLAFIAWRPTGLFGSRVE